MACELYPREATIAAGDCVVLHCGTGEAAPAGVEWHLDYGCGKVIDGVYKAPRLLFWTRRVAVRARLGNECAAAAIVVSSVRTWVPLLIAYMAASGAALAVALVMSWREMASGGVRQDTLGLLRLVSLSGAAGAWMDGLNSLVAHLGARRFEPQWVPYYLARPVLGAGFAYLSCLAFCETLLGSLQTAGMRELFAACAFAGLVGLFTDTAMAKLKDVFEALLNPRTDSRPGKLRGGRDEAGSPAADRAATAE
jgi:hypothetical protein